MRLSLGEVEAMAKKATRGAGYPWGMADEAGFAVRWLEERGQGGIAALSGWLPVVAERDIRSLAPLETTAWKSASGELCPLLTGTALADSAGALGETGFTLENLNASRLLLPFLAQVAEVRKEILSAKVHGLEATIDAAGVSLSAEWPLTKCDVAIARSNAPVEETPRCTRATPDPDDWQVLTRFAARTYAPVTEASRLKGAGAGLTDND